MRVGRGVAVSLHHVWGIFVCAGALRLRRALDDEAATLRAVAPAFACDRQAQLWEFVATAARSCKKSWLLAELRHRVGESFNFAPLLAFNELKIQVGCHQNFHKK